MMPCESNRVHPRQIGRPRVVVDLVSSDKGASMAGFNCQSPVRCIQYSVTSISTATVELKEVTRRQRQVENGHGRDARPHLNKAFAWRGRLGSAKPKEPRSLHQAAQLLP